MGKALAKIGTICWLALSLLLCHSQSWAWRGKVVELHDGDSGVLFKGFTKVKFRMYGIDAPEYTQDFGPQAKSAASRMLLWNDLEIQTLDRDRYGREVILAYVDGTCVNEELIKGGFAWMYEAYCDESFCGRWAELQQQAKNQRKGLWTKRNPMPPWKYREQKRASRPPGVMEMLAGLVTDYHGNAATKVFHRFGCKHYDCRDCTVRFANREEAIRAGYKPCGGCNP